VHNGLSTKADRLLTKVQATTQVEWSECPWHWGKPYCLPWTLGPGTISDCSRASCRLLTWPESPSLPPRCSSSGLWTHWWIPHGTRVGLVQSPSEEHAWCQGGKEVVEWKNEPGCYTGILQMAAAPPNHLVFGWWRVGDIVSVPGWPVPSVHLPEGGRLWWLPT